MPNLQQQEQMKTLSRLMIAAVVGMAVGWVAVHTTSAHVKRPVLGADNRAAPLATASPAYSDWQGAIGQSFGARILAPGQPSRTTANPFNGMDKMQPLSAP